jgi:hypothetical protein
VTKTQVLMAGKLVIRSMIDTDKLVDVDGNQSPRPKLMVNGSEVTKKQLRWLSSESEKMEHPSDTSTNGHIDGYMRTTKYSFVVPTTRRDVFAGKPFNITSFDVTLDFQPFIARLPDGELMKFMPDLLCPTGDMRNLVCVEPEQLDSLSKLDMVNRNPSVEIKLVSEAKRLVHASSMKITFHGHTDAVRVTLNTMVPILFIGFGNVLNVWFSEDYDSFQSNALTLGLTLIVFIPTLYEMNVGPSVVFAIFLGLVFGSLDCVRCNGEDAAPLGIPN